MNVRGLRKLLEELELGPAFIEHLGWSPPEKALREWQAISVRGHVLERRALASLGHAEALEVRSRHGGFPDARTRELVYKELAKRHPESLVVFVDGRRTKSFWCWTRREQGTDTLRTHVHLRGQPGGPLVEKVAILHSELGRHGRGQDESVAGVARRLREAMDPMPLTSRLTRDLQRQHALLTQHLQGVPDTGLRHAYAGVLLYRVILLAFLRQKELPDRAHTYSKGEHLEVGERESTYLSHTEMRALLFEGVVRPSRSHPSRRFAVLERARQLGGGIFLPHDMEATYPGLDLPAEAIEELLQFVDRYSWALETIPPWEGEVTPDVVDECFDRALRPRHAGAYRTPPEISSYLCEQAVHPVILEALRRGTGVRFKSFNELLVDLDTDVCRQLLHEVLPGLRLLDFACRSGTLLEVVMEELVSVHLAAIHHIEAERDENLLAEVTRWRRARGGLGYFIRKRILTRNLFGVDGDEAMAEAARSRLLLRLLSTAERKTWSDPLPSLEFNILSGNALIGLTDTTHELVRESPPGRDGLEFGDVLEEHRGFDAIFTFPPWEALSGPDLVNDRLRRAYPHSAQGTTRPGLYKLFIERAFQLLRPGGRAAMVVPASFYSDQGGRKLRRWLLEQGALRVVLGLSNEYHLFEDVHRHLKLCLLVFGKDGPASSFEVAFRVDPREAIQRKELDAFLHDDSSRLTLTGELVERLSPTSLSIPELRSQNDLVISEKMMQFPLLEQQEVARWTLGLQRSPSFRRVQPSFEAPPSLDRLPLCSGGMIQQYGFDADAASSRVLGQGPLVRPRDHVFSTLETYRLVLRTIARSTDMRTLIATLLPPRVLFDHSVLMLDVTRAPGPWAHFYFVALFNSFVLDYLVRQRLAGPRILVSILMVLPIPRIEPSNARLRSIALRAARLICTTPDFDAAAHDVGLRGHQDSAVEYVERTRLQAEIEGLVAHLYMLTEEEFAHILSTFPLVPAAQRTAAHHAFRDVTHGVIE